MKHTILKVAGLILALLGADSAFADKIGNLPATNALFANTAGNSFLLNGNSWDAPENIGTTTPGQSFFTLQSFTTTSGGPSPRFTFQTNGAEAANNTGSQLLLSAIADDGTTTLGNIFRIVRSTGFRHEGAPTIASQVASNFNVSQADSGVHVSGNQYAFTDTQKITTLTSPISTVSGSNLVSIAYPAHGLTTANLANVIATSAVGGVTLNGAYPVDASTTTNVLVVKYTTTATSTAGPGGGSTTVQSNALLQGMRSSIVNTSNAPGFSIGLTDIFTANPTYLTPLTSSVGQSTYQGHWWISIGPNDLTGLNAFQTEVSEMDLVCRSGDKGFRPNFYIYPNMCHGIVMVPESKNFGAAGLGDGYNSDMAFVVGHSGGANSQTHYPAQFYQGFNISPNSLVGALQDTTTGLGGVGGVWYGAYNPTAVGGFVVASSGVSTVTITLQTGILNLTTANSIYIPKIYTIGGLTFGGQSYSIASVVSTGVVTITVSGTSTGAGTGGIAGDHVSFDAYVPQGVLQVSGEFATGIDFTDAHIDGGIAFNAGQSKIKAKGITLGQAGTCNTGNSDTLYSVSDGVTSPTYRQAYSGGGTAHQLVYCDGTSFTYH